MCEGEGGEKGGEAWYEGSERGVVEERVGGVWARVSLFCGTVLTRVFGINVRSSF